MKILRNNKLRLAGLALVVAFFASAAGAQVKSDANAVLAAFDKNIELGKLSETEGDLFRYVVANPNDARGFALLAKLRFRQGRLNEAKSLLNKALSIDARLLSAKLTLARVSLQLGDVAAAKEIVAGLDEKQLADATSRLTAAELAVQAGDCATAIRFADKLPVAKKNGDALPLRASCLLEAADVKGVVALIPLAKSSARTNPKIAIQFAGVLGKAALNKEVVELLRSVVAVAPRNTDALLLLAKAEIFLKDFANAKLRIAQAEKAAPPSAELLFVKGLLESEQGNNVGSLTLLEQSLAEKPDDVQVLSRFVVVALRANQAGKALRAAEKLLAMQPENLDFLYLKGIASLQANSLPAAESALRKFHESRPSDGLGCLALGMTFAAQPERIGEARQQLEKCLAINPNNFEASYQLGLSYKAQGDAVKAIDFLERTIKLAPEYAMALRDLGTVYLQVGGEAKARPVLEKAAALAPNDAETHFQLSRLYNLIGERELAKKELEIFQRLRNPKKDGM